MTKSFVVGWLATAVSFAVMDLIWLAVIANGLYKTQMGDLRAESVHVPAAILFYLIMVTGIVVFAVLPALRSDSVWVALGGGAFFGFVCYAAYDLTNLATLKNWPVGLTMVDLAWGTVLTALATVAGYWAARLAGK